MSLHLYQYKGPFNYNSTEPLVKYQTSSGKIRHLGVQVPYNTPFPFVFQLFKENDSENTVVGQVLNKTDFTMNFNGYGTKSYRMSPNGILEFSDLDANEIIIRGNSLNRLPRETIIDILVEE